MCVLDWNYMLVIGSWPLSDRYKENKHVNSSKGQSAHCRVLPALRLDGLHINGFLSHSNVPVQVNLKVETPLRFDVAVCLQFIDHLCEVSPLLSAQRSCRVSSTGKQNQDF